MEALMKLNSSKGLSQALRSSEEKERLEAEKRARSLGYRSSEELKNYLVRELEKAYQA